MPEIAAHIVDDPLADPAPSPDAPVNTVNVTLSAAVAPQGTLVIAVPTLRWGDIVAGTRTFTVNGVNQPPLNVRYSVDFTLQQVSIQNLTYAEWPSGASVTLTWQGLVIEPQVTNNTSAVASLQSALTALTARVTTLEAKQGVTDGSNASPGQLGEFLSAAVQVGNAIPATTNVIMDVVTLSVPPGDWDLFGQVCTNIASGGHAQNGYAWMSTTSATVPATIFGAAHQIGGIASGNNEQLMLPTGRQRMSLTTTTTIYLSTRIQFTGTASFYGYISARRVR